MMQFVKRLKSPFFYGRNDVLGLGAKQLAWVFVNQLSVEIDPAWMIVL